MPGWCARWCVPLRRRGTPPAGPAGGASRCSRPAGPDRSVGGGSVLGGAVLASAPADAGLEEAVELAVEDRRRVADLEAGPQILDDLVGVQHVVAHLVAPARGHVALELL